MSWKGAGPDWPASTHRACCRDAVLLAKLCAVDNLGLFCSSDECYYLSTEYRIAGQAAVKLKAPASRVY